MSEIILGTAGHIDHGKTTLIKALTGIDTDRLLEEKKRGITVDLGFAHMLLPSGHRLGIVDVPGHERFIKNMVAGASGIDMVLFIVAADEGIMPQTREHLNILRILEVQRGLTVLTKNDIVDDEWLELVTDEVREQIKGTFLEKAPIIPVSSITGDGIRQLISAIDKMCSEQFPKDTESPFRLPIDRRFTLPGIGTVVTGSLTFGTAKVGDEIEILPKGKKSRIRSIQIHGKTVDRAEVGRRIALNLHNVKVDDLERGDVVAKPGTFLPVTKILAHFHLLENAPKSLKSWERVRFHTGTKEVMARLVLLDRDRLLPGEGAFVQVLFEELITCAYKDRYVVRSYSPISTIGGGQILYVNPVKIKKRARKRILQILQDTYNGNLQEFILGLFELSGNKYLKISQIAAYAGKNSAQIDVAVKSLVSQNKVVVFKISGEYLVVDKQYYKYISGQTLSVVKNYHNKYPLSNGIDREELRSRLKIEADLFDNLLNLWMETGVLGISGNSVRKKGFTVELTEIQQIISDKIIKLYNETNWSPPSTSEIILDFPSDYETEVRRMLSRLIDDGKLIKLNEELYMSRKWVKRSIILLKKHFENNRECTVSQFRKMLGTTRKYAIPLLEYMDGIKVTKRQANGTRCQAPKLLSY